MKHIFLFAAFTGAFLFGTAQNPKQTAWQYVEMYRDISVKEMQRTGVPASIKLGQGILESRFGTSNLAVNANNHFGKKPTSDWKGEVFYIWTTEYDKKGVMYKDSAAFKKYNLPEQSFLDHSEYLLRPRYKSAFQKCSPYDCACWAREIKLSGYATNPKYDSLLVATIKRYKLGKYDTLALKGQPIVTNPKLNEPATTIPANQTSLADLRKELEKQLKASNKDNYALKNQLALLQYMEDKYNQMGADYQKAVKRTTEIRVQKGDNIRKISELYGVPIENIRAYNELSFRDTLVPGKILHLIPTLNFRSSPDLPLVATQWHNLDEDDWKNETFPVEEAQMLLQWELVTEANLEKKDIQIWANEQAINAVKGSEELTLISTNSESIYGKNTYIYSATIDFSKKTNQLQNMQLLVNKNGKQLKSNILRFYYAAGK